MIDSLTKIFEVCIAFVAAILGLAYPMFVERINGIVDKYGSPNISKKFKHETSYICFNVLMVVCIIELFVFPIIMMAVSTQFCNLLLISIQGICVFTLCMIIIRVFFLVMTYNDPHSFLNRIKTNDTDEKKLLSSLQILIEYGSRNDAYADIYREAMDMLVERIFKFQKGYVDMDKKSQTEQIPNEQEIIEIKDTSDNGSTKQTPVEYPKHIFDTLKQLSISSAKPGNPALNKDTEIVDALYNLNDDFPITIQAFDFMWNWIKRMVEENHNEWIRQYWLVANRTNYSKWGYYDDEERKGADKFLEFHLMVGVLFLRWNRYDFIRYIFTSYSLRLPKYPLIPSSFIQIFNYYETFPWSEDIFSKCNLFKNWEGPLTEKKITNLVFDYITLLVVRLFDNTHGGSRELPHVGATIEENEHKINRIETIIWHLEKISDDTIKALNFEVEWKQDAKDLLKRYKDECEKENENLKTRQRASEEKRENIKQSLIETSKKSNPFLPSSECRSKEDGDEIFLADLEKKLPDELILANRRLIPRPDFVESVIHGPYIQLREFYFHKLLQIDAIKTYSVTKRDLGKMLKQLELTSEYAIVAIKCSPNSLTTTKGINIDESGIFYQSSCGGDCIKVHYIHYDNDNALLIMKEEDVPRFKYRDLEESEYDKNEYCEIESEKHLYSNIDNITETDFTLKAKQGFYVHIPKPLKYVCIRIQSSLESAATDVSNVEPIKNLIK